MKKIFLSTTIAAFLLVCSNLIQAQDTVKDLDQLKLAQKCYWSYSYTPERDNFYMFAAFVKGGCMLGIGSFTAENKWHQEGFEMFNRDKSLGKAEFVFDTPTSLTATGFNPDGAKLWEIKATKIK
jgi:hypothetical protein